MSVGDSGDCDLGDVRPNAEMILLVAAHRNATDSFAHRSEAALYTCFSKQICLRQKHFKFEVNQYCLRKALKFRRIISGNHAKYAFQKPTSIELVKIRAVEGDWAVIAAGVIQAATSHHNNVTAADPTVVARVSHEIASVVRNCEHIVKLQQLRHVPPQAARV